jgi:cell division protein FtsL
MSSFSGIEKVAIVILVMILATFAIYDLVGRV